MRQFLIEIRADVDGKLYQKIASLQSINFKILEFIRPNIFIIRTNKKIKEVGKLLTIIVTHHFIQGQTVKTHPS